MTGIAMILRDDQQLFQVSAKMAVVLLTSEINQIQGRLGRTYKAS